MSQSDATGRVREVLVPPTEALGLDLEAVEVSAAGRRRLLRVVVDKDGGVSLDDISDATKAMNAALDESEAMGSVPTPSRSPHQASTRPLTLPRHWRRNSARLVTVALTDGTKLTGRIARAGDDAAVLDVGGGTQQVAYDDVAKALVQVEFTRKEP